jgi:hypothetical protein
MCLNCCCGGSSGKTANDVVPMAHDPSAETNDKQESPAASEPQDTIGASRKTETETMPTQFEMPVEANCREKSVEANDYPDRTTARSPASGVLDGARYSGEFKDSLRHGVGKLQWANGDTYDGSWVVDRRHGHGIFTIAQGAVYDGDFHDDEMHGRGELRWPNGDVYVGEFRHGCRDGVGTFAWGEGEAAGDRYEGPLATTMPQCIKPWSKRAGQAEYQRGREDGMEGRREDGRGRKGGRKKAREPGRAAFANSRTPAFRIRAGCGGADSDPAATGMTWIRMRRADSDPDAAG